MEKNESPRRLRRKARLIDLLAEFGGAAQVARESGTPKSHLSAMVSGTRGLGDKLAEKLESQYGKPTGWFDSASGTMATKEPSHDAVAIAGILPPTSNVETIGFRRTSDSAEKALRVLADILRPMSNLERDVVANNLRSFAIDPDSAVALSSLLAGLDAANARRRYDPPQQFTGSHGG